MVGPISNNPHPSSGVGAPKDAAENLTPEQYKALENAVVEIEGDPVTTGLNPEQQKIMDNLNADMNAVVDRLAGELN